MLSRYDRAKRFCRRLPDGFMVWFVIAMGLFCRDSYRQVHRGLRSRGRTGTPGRSTLCEARHRIGVAPLRALAQAVVRLLGTPDTPGAYYRDMRLMAIDGFVLNIPDSPANARVFGRPKGGRASGAFPQARVLALCETGSHVLWRWVIKSIRVGEPTMARHLMRHLTRGMLLLLDRDFRNFKVVSETRSRGAHLLARVKKNQVFEPFRRLSDGSYLSKMYPATWYRRHDRKGLTVRLIEYALDDPARPGHETTHRLVTTLLDPELDPAVRLVELDHERWEEELAIDEVKTHQRERPVLRSQTPQGVLQEIHGLLLARDLVRVLMHEAAERQGIDPRRVSFTGAIQIVRCRLPQCPKSPRGLRAWRETLVQEIAEEILPKRRNRINPRVINVKMSRWEKKKPKHLHPPQPEKEFRDAIVIT